MQDNVTTFLDCTLRDGGYYTQWDFDESLVSAYLETMEKLPVDFIEIGYKSKSKKNYAGAYYYLPDVVLDFCKARSSKKLAVILNEKEVAATEASSLLKNCIQKIDLVRLAVAPENIERSLTLAQEVKNLGFSVAINLMYASSWEEEFLTNIDLQKIEDVANYFYVVDSYGGLQPDKISKIFSFLKTNSDLKLGFHGHNNIEMALANSLQAMRSGATIIDATICGMGRGAGNLKTELLFAFLHSQKKLNVDFDALYKITKKFSNLKQTYAWGTNLPYMVSGAYSLPQNSVYSKVNKRYYSLNSIVRNVRALKNDQFQLHDAQHMAFPEFFPSEKNSQVLLVGGGKTPQKFSRVLLNFLKQNPKMPIIFASSKNVSVFKALKNPQYHCLPGREAERLKPLLPPGNIENHHFLVPSKNLSSFYTWPENFKKTTSLLKCTDFIEGFEASVTAMGVQIALKLSAKEIFVTGYDGYYGTNISENEWQLFEENQQFFEACAARNIQIFALTPTQYTLNSRSIFDILCH